MNAPTLPASFRGADPGVTRASSLRAAGPRRPRRRPRPVQRHDSASRQLRASGRMRRVRWWHRGRALRPDRAGALSLPVFEPMLRRAVKSNTSTLCVGSSPARGRRCVRKRPTVRPEEASLAVIPQFDHESLLVNGPVVTSAQKDKILEPRRAAVGPVAHVVGVAVAAAAPGEAAPVVPGRQRAL